MKGITLWKLSWHCSIATFKSITDQLVRRHIPLQLVQLSNKTATSSGRKFPSEREMQSECIRINELSKVKLVSHLLSIHSYIYFTMDMMMITSYLYQRTVPKHGSDMRRSHSLGILSVMNPAWFQSEEQDNRNTEGGHITQIRVPWENTWPTLFPVCSLQQVWSNWKKILIPGIRRGCAITAQIIPFNWKWPC